MFTGIRIGLLVVRKMAQDIQIEVIFAMLFKSLQ